MRKLITSFISLMAGNIFSLATSFVLALLLLQKLSPADYSLQSAIVAFSGIVFGFADLGLLAVATRDLSRQSVDEQRVFYGGLLTLQLALSTVVCLIAVIVAWVLNSFPGGTFVIFLMGIFSLVLSYAPIIPTEALLTVRGKVHRMVLLQSFYAGGVVVLGAIILLTGGGIGLIYVAFSVLSVVTIALYMREAFLLLAGRIRLSSLNWRYYLGQGIPIGLSAALFSSCLQLGTYLTFTYGNTADAGYLGVSNLLIQAVISIVWVPFIIVIFPHLSRIDESGFNLLKWIGSRTITWLAAITLPIAVGTMILAPDILAFLSQTQILAAPILRIMIWALPLAIIATFMYRLLLVRSQQSLYIIATVGGAAVNGVLCILLIPNFGGVGAAIAAVVGLSVVTIIALWALRNLLFEHLRIFDLIRIGFALLAMIVGLTATPQLYVLLRILLGAFIYVFLLLVFRFVSINDLQAIRTMPSASSGLRDSVTSPRVD